MCDRRDAAYMEELVRLTEIGKQISNGVQLIAEERQRQIEQEGWTPEHDDQHYGDELVFAALCYAIPQDFKDECVSTFWPWSNQEWYKPTPNDRIRELTKAGALIAAEIDRLQRKEAE